MKKRLVILFSALMLSLNFTILAKAQNSEVSNSTKIEEEAKEDDSVRRYIVSDPMKIGISVILGLTLSSVVTYSKSMELKTVQHAVAADYYAEQFNLREKSDLFLYSQHFVTKRPTSNNES